MIIRKKGKASSSVNAFLHYTFILRLGALVCAGTCPVTVPLLHNYKAPLLSKKKRDSHKRDLAKRLNFRTVIHKNVLKTQPLIHNKDLKYENHAKDKTTHLIFDKI